MNRFNRKTLKTVGAGTRRPTNASILPKEAGKYFWSEWNAEVDVYKKKGGKYLYVVPPGQGSPEVRITPFIAGVFSLVEKETSV